VLTVGGLDPSRGSTAKRVPPAIPKQVRAEYADGRIHEWLALHAERLPALKALDLRVAVQDPCHLRHMQRVHDTTRTVLRPVVAELLELDDDLCCGAGVRTRSSNPNSREPSETARSLPSTRSTRTWSPAQTRDAPCTSPQEASRPCIPLELVRRAIKSSFPDVPP